MLDLRIKFIRKHSQYYITRDKKSQRTSIAFRNDPEKILIIGEKYAKKKWNYENIKDKPTKIITCKIIEIK